METAMGPRISMARTVDMSGRLRTTVTEPGIYSLRADVTSARFRTMAMGRSTCTALMAGMGIGRYRSLANTWLRIIERLAVFVEEATRLRAN
jgi:hypothetical protein